MVHACFRSIVPATHVRFEIHAAHCHQTLTRIVEALSATHHVPLELRYRRSCGGAFVHFDLRIAEGDAEGVAERIRAAASVEAVIVVHPPRRIIQRPREEGSSSTDDAAVEAVGSRIPEGVELSPA